MAIDRAFTVAGHGTVVTGTVASGVVSVGDDLEWLPEGRTVRVRGLHRHDRPVERVGRGRGRRSTSSGVHHAEVRRGQELAAPGYLVADPRPLRRGPRRRRRPPAAPPPGPLPPPPRHRRGRRDARPARCRRAVGRAARRSAQLFLGEPVAAVSGQPFVLREESPPATLGGGRVLQPSARRVRRRDRASIARIGRLRSPDPVDARLGRARRVRPPTLDRPRPLPRGRALPPTRSARRSPRLTASGALVELPVGPRRSVRVPAEFAADLEDRALRALGRLHAARPRQSAIPRAHVAAELPDLASDALVAGLLDRLKAAALVVARRPRRSPSKGHEPRLSQGERKLKAELAASIRAGGFSPPEVADLAAAAGARAAAVPDLLALLRDEEQVVEIGPQLYLDFEAAAELRRLVVARLSDGSTMTMADLRDLLGTTRKYAVPIGEYLDRVGLTVRDGDVRRLGPGVPRASTSGSLIRER